MQNDFAKETSFQDSTLIIQQLFTGEVDLLKLHQAYPDCYPFLLESVAQSQNLESALPSAQYDILFAYPQQRFTLDSIESAQAFTDAFNQDFQAASIANEIRHDEVMLPFRGGWFAYFSYDYAEVIEPSLHLPRQQANLVDADEEIMPLAIIDRVPCAFIYERTSKVLTLIAETGFEAHLKTMSAHFFELNDLPLDVQTNQVLLASEEPEQKYLQGIAEVKEYILSGDIFQVNLSRQWQVELSQDDAVSIYAALRQHNPAPFAALVDFGGWQIISSSPERLVRYQFPWVETRPIAGTRQRSADFDADKALIEELRNHPKEIAEHIMLIDLERNDLGRICQAGSVEVNELMAIETYEHVHHIVSNIRGHLKAGLTPLDIIHATFPGGTITGCPKIRCMEIIAELEKMPRAAYTGSLGYINRDGSLDLNILIRTMQKQGKHLTFRAGAGIVADSIAENELMESRHKAKGLINALEQGI